MTPEEVLNSYTNKRENKWCVSNMRRKYNVLRTSRIQYQPVQVDRSHRSAHNGRKGMGEDEEIAHGDRVRNISGSGDVLRMRAIYAVKLDVRPCSARIERIMARNVQRARREVTRHPAQEPMEWGRESLLNPQVRPR